MNAETILLPSAFVAVATAPSALVTSMSATVMCEYASRFDAIATKADPTPPAPTTRTRMGRGYFTTSAGRRNADCVINLRTGAAV